MKYFRKGNRDIRQDTVNAKKGGHMQSQLIQTHVHMGTCVFCAAFSLDFLQKNGRRRPANLLKVFGVSRPLSCTVADNVILDFGLPRLGFPDFESHRLP